MMNAISLRGLGKSYAKEQGGLRRLREIVAGRPISPDQQIEVLKEIDLDIPMGQVVGIIGRNGAGKSTLLKVVAGMVPHTAGSMEVSGRVAALLELGSGFHPEMTGRENVYLAASLAGLKRDEIDEKYESIVTFSGIQEFIDRPVKTYSSGMMVRLAFSVATSVDPDILIIDEALSVGDGIFSRKSFERIMEFKEKKKTILFCSHSLFQIEALCDRVVWIDGGKVQLVDEPKLVTAEYNEFLSKTGVLADKVLPDEREEIVLEEKDSNKLALISAVEIFIDGKPGVELNAVSSISSLEVLVNFFSKSGIPIPTVAMTITDPNGQIVTSAGTLDDGWDLTIDSQGNGIVRIMFDQLPLLKGRYIINIFLLCEKGVHFYDVLYSAASFSVVQTGMAVGFCVIPHGWSNI